MPLDKSGSKESVGKNIKTEEAVGKSKKQSIAIALSEERANAKGARKAKLTEEYDKHMKGSEEKGETKKETRKAEVKEMA